jgi:hypothetical protein
MMAARDLDLSLARAREAGVLDEPKDLPVRCRVPRGLLEQAKRASGIEETSELIRVALAHLAFEDGFSTWFQEQAGTIPADIDLGIPD